jgi:transcriptional regulator of acetoin/glycerol metabolism
MRTPIPITAEQVTEALNAANGDTGEAADRLGVSEKTLKRRIKKFGLKPRVRYEVAEAA